MKKTTMLFLLMLGCLSFLPSGLLANASPESENFNVIAPENLEVTVVGPTWLQVAWDPVIGANGYQVTTRVFATGVIVSQFTIDRENVVISGLQQGVMHQVSVAGLRGDTPGPESSVKDTPDLPLVFDLVLRLDMGTKPEIDCTERCNFSCSPEAETLEHFECSLLKDENEEYLPFWIKVELDIPNNPLTENYILMHFTFEPIPGDYNIRTRLYQASPRPWGVRVDENNDNLLHITSGTYPIADVEFEYVISDKLQIDLAPGYIFTVLEACEEPGSQGLAEQANAYLIYERLIAESINSNNDQLGVSSFSAKTSPAFRVINPVKNELELRFEKPTGQAAILELYSMSGVMIVRQQLPEGVFNHQLPVPNLPSGSYLLRVSLDGLLYNKLVIKS